ncbi:MAG: hypothetical protein ACRDQD_01155 [Nocardioidaceae bacterium]
MFAVAGWRYEPEWLVEGLRANLSWCDQVVIVDDRARTELWVHEGEYRHMQRAALIEAGARPWDWILVTSPDERWSRGAGQTIRRLAQHRLRVVYEFQLREMWTRHHWRIDGQWGRKRRQRLFPFLPDQMFDGGRIQTQPTPTGDGYSRRFLPRPCVYHVENIDPASRVERAIVYDVLSPGSADVDPPAKWLKVDPEGRYITRYGFAYLADPRGVRLARVPSGEITPPVRTVYEFRVPDELLYAEAGIGRDELVARLAATLGISRRRLFARVHG